MLPRHLVFTRHGESEGNVAMNAAKNGDTSYFNERYVNTPGRKWALSPRGVAQARAMGEWLRSEMDRGAFDNSMNQYRFYSSPYTRTRHTAGHLGLAPREKWRLNRDMRERDWGHIETMPKDLYRKEYKHAALQEKIDPLYWRPPGGESVADLSSNRVLNVFDTFHRECADATVFATVHGEWIRGFLLTITRANDEDYWIWDHGFPTDKHADLPSAPPLDYTSDLANLFGGKLHIPNCATFHLSRVQPNVDPHLATVNNRMAWLRIAAPVEQPDGSWRTEVTQDWTPFGAKLLTDSDLLSW